MFGNANVLLCNTKKSKSNVSHITRLREEEEERQTVGELDRAPCVCLLVRDKRGGARERRRSGTAVLATTRSPLNHQ